MVIGDFNAVIGSHEKRRGPPPLSISCDEFTAFTDMCDLIHMDIDGAEFTWTNGSQARSRINFRLDRALCNVAWYSI